MGWERACGTGLEGTRRDEKGHYGMGKDTMRWEGTLWDGKRQYKMGRNTTGWDGSSGMPGMMPLASFTPHHYGILGIRYRYIRRIRMLKCSAFLL